MLTLHILTLSVFPLYHESVIVETDSFPAGFPAFLHSVTISFSYA